MSRAPTIAALALVAAIACPGEALAWVHIARAAETLDQLAARYYGRVELAMAIRAANGFVHPDDGRLIQGERIELPEVTYHRVREGETWEQIAEQYLGSSRRGPFLAELNGSDPAEALPEGRIVKVPYQLLHILAPDETLKSVVRLYLGRKHSQRWLKEYNLTQKKKFGRGDALLVPLIDVEFTDEQRRRIDEERGARYKVEDQRTQIDAVAQIAVLREGFATGRYVEMVAVGQRLLHAGTLTVPQQIGVHKYLAFAYVALGQRELAQAAFGEALRLQPGMELSPITTSPKILAAFQEARERARAKAPAEPRQ